jgi:membrane fusion protein (multidrug efflux system)
MEDPTTMKFARATRPVTLLVLSGLLAGGCGNGSSAPAGRNPGRGGAASPVEVVVIRPQLLKNKITATGTLLANEEVQLRPEISGLVTGVFFKEGQRVEKAALMLKINDRELQAQLKRKSLEEKLSTDEEQRKRRLFEIKGISQEEYDKSLNALRIIQAEREVLESQLAKTEIHAPFEGVVGLRYVSEGSYVTPAMLVATMQDLDPMKAEFSVPEKYARQLKDGTEVQVRAGESEADRKGIIYAIESKIDPGTRTIKARARIPNPDGILIPGAFARLEIMLEEIPDAILVPAGAIIPELAGQKVYVCRDGQAKSVPVQTGLRTEKDIQITSGLSVNDTLIVTGLLQLTDGKRVQAKPYDGT